MVMRILKFMFLFAALISAHTLYAQRVGGVSVEQRRQRTLSYRHNEGHWRRTVCLSITLPAPLWAPYSGRELAAGYSPAEMEALVQLEVLCRVSGKIEDRYLYYYKKQSPESVYDKHRLPISTVSTRLLPYRDSLPGSDISGETLSKRKERLPFR